MVTSYGLDSSTAAVPETFKLNFFFKLAKNFKQKFRNFVPRLCAYWQTVF